MAVTTPVRRSRRAAAPDARNSVKFSERSVRAAARQAKEEARLEKVRARAQSQAARALRNPTLLNRYIEASRAAGVPYDQIHRLLRAGIVLQPKQLRASAISRMCDVEGGPVEIGYGGARGGGKSHWLLAQLAEDCLRCPGLKCLLLRKVGKSNRENFEDLRQKVLHSVPNVYKRQDGVLVFKNGSRIHLGHFQNENNIDAYLGLEYDVIGVEEATTLSNSKYKAIQSCNRTSKPNWRPRMYSTTNPGGVGHAWYKKRFIDPMRDKREVDTRFIQATVDDNAMVNSGYRKVLDGFVGWMLKAWRFGDWDIAAGQYFTNWRSFEHVIDPFKIPKGWTVWCSLDYGFTHYTVCHLLAQDGDGNIYIVDEHAERGKLVPHHAMCIKAMLARNGLKVENLWKFVAGHDVFADKGGKTIAQDYEDQGIILQPANIERINGAGEILARLGDVANPNSVPPTRDIPARLFVMRRCALLIEQIPALEHDPKRPEDVLKVDCDEEGIGGDDAYDSARYGVMAAWGNKGIPVVGGENQVLERWDRVQRTINPEGDVLSPGSGLRPGAQGSAFPTGPRPALAGF